MATSGSADWTRTRNQIATAALRKVGACAQGDSPTNDQLTEAIEALNLVVKELQNDGVRLWTVEWKVATFTASTEVTGTDSNIYTCIRSHTSADANKPVTGAQWTVYWILRGSTGGTWSADQSYTSVNEVLVDTDTVSIEQAFIRDETGYDHQVEIIGRHQYFDIINKGDTGRPQALFFDHLLSNAIYLWPHVDDTDDVLHYHRVRLLEDFDAAANTPDAPVRWIGVMVWKTAVELAPEYGLPVQERDWLERKAEMSLKRVKRGDKEVIDRPFVTSAFYV